MCLLSKVDIPFAQVASAELDRGAAQEIATEQNSRHELWTRRSSGTSTSGANGWRPKRTYRRTAKKLCMAIDNQVVVVLQPWGAVGRHLAHRFGLSPEVLAWRRLCFCIGLP